MHMSTRTMAAVALMAMGLGLAGCDKVKAPAPGRPDPLSAAAYPKITPMDGLAKNVVFGLPTLQPSTGSRPMSVTVPVRNTADYGVHTQYRFEFFDKDGRPLASNQGWRFLHLDPRVEYFMEGSALETTAVDWRLQVRPAR